MRLLIPVLVCGLVLAGWTVLADVSKPGQPRAGGVFKLSDELGGLTVPQGKPFARKLLSDGGHSSTFAFKGTGGVKPHYHRDHDEIVYVVSGTGTFTLDGETTDIGPGHVLVIPAGVVHSATFAGESEALIINGPKLDPARPDRVWVDEAPQKP